eukprot:129850_1
MSIMNYSMLMGLILFVMVFYDISSSNVLWSKQFISEQKENELWIMYKHQKISPRSVIALFSQEVMQNNLLLKRHLLIGPVLDACKKTNNVSFAQRVWHYITQEGGCMMKPNQLCYAKMLSVYTWGRDGKYFEEGKQLTEQWIYEYQADPASLQHRLTGNAKLNSPIILNQMMKSVLHHRKIKKIRREWIIYYMTTMIQLNIQPDLETAWIIVNTLNLLDAIELLQKVPMTNIDTKSFILDHMVQPILINHDVIVKSNTYKP